MPIVEVSGIYLRWLLGLYNYTDLSGEFYGKYEELLGVPMFIFYWLK
jgi:hypothetical protein